MKLILILIPAALMAQSRQPSPLAIGGQNCGEVRLEKAFPSGGEYLAWRNCLDGSTMGMELVNNGGTVKARISNSATPNLTMFNSSSQAGSVLSGLGTLTLLNAGIQRVSVIASTPALRLLDTSGAYIAAMDASGAGGVFTSEGTDVTLSQTGDSSGGMSLTLRNRLAENGMILANPTLDLADVILRGSTGTQRSIRLENRSGSGLTYLEGSPEFQFGNMGSYPGGIGLMANANGAGVYKGDYFRWLGSSSGYVGLKAPATAPSIDWTLPSGSGSSGQCWGYSSSGVLAWVSCGGGGSYVDLTTAQSIAGNKFFSDQARSTTFYVSGSLTGGIVQASYLAGSGAGVSEWWSGTSGAKTILIDGFYSGSTDTGAMTFLDPSGGAETITIRGGSSTTNPQVRLNRGGTQQALLGASSSVGGFLQIYTSGGNQSVFIDGTGNGQIRVSDGTSLRTGFTGTVNFSTCTAATVVMGLYITGC